jgi:hypothetical protein
MLFGRLDYATDVYTYFNMYYHCYVTIARRNMHCLVAADRHINSIRAVSRQPPITTIEALLELVFSVGPTLRLYSKDSSLAK